MYKFNKVFIISIVIPLLLNGLAALLGMSGMAEYRYFVKPPLSPPGILSGIVWGILYVLMGIGSAFIYCSNRYEKNNAIGVYAVQLTVNFLWTIFFFVFRWRLFSFFWILLLIGLVALMIRQFYRVYPLAGYLQVPCLLWVLFMGYLNFGVWYLNR